MLAAVLGAGASRNVHYNAGRMPIESPLDFDFFDILQRLEPRKQDQKAVEETLKQVETLPYDCWRSLEKAFYTLHLEAVMRSRLESQINQITPAEVVRLFVRSFQALLRAAHGKHFCVHHRELVQRLWQHDAILSFNYDLVIERALEHLASDLEQKSCVQPWLYGRGNRPSNATIPTVFKLHGSSNWLIDENGVIEVRPLNKAPGYQASSSVKPPIILPFWEKPVDELPWVHLWRDALTHLRKTQDLLVWGYSLPTTDIKTQYLFKLAKESEALEHLCVIDPSENTQRRWRELFPKAKYRQFRSFEEFSLDPPGWWKSRPENCRK